MPRASCLVLSCVRPATPCTGGCNPTCGRLQPYVPQVSLGLALVFGEIYGCVGEPSAATVAERVAVRASPP